MHFHVISPAFNAADFIEEAVASVKSQRYADFRHIVVDDRSSDDTAARALAAGAGDERFQVLRNEQKLFALGSCWRGICASDPREDDVIVVLDGDDRFAHPGVLDRLADAYADPGCWMTYGSFTDMNGKRDKSARSYPKMVVSRSLYRKEGWSVPHLRTFRYKLWKRIPWESLSVTAAEVCRARRRALAHGRLRHWWHWRGIEVDDLLDASGRFTRRLCDKVPAYAMLEMAGHRARFIADVLLHYRTYEKDLGFPRKEGESRIQKWYTRLIRDIVEHREPLGCIDDAADTSPGPVSRPAPVAQEQSVSEVAGARQAAW